MKKFQNIPVLEDPVAFANEWSTWWIALQPDWRKPQAGSNNVLPKPISTMAPNEDLRTLLKGGPAGLVTIILGLKWWGDTGHDLSAWRCAVADVQECLTTLLSYSLKRKSGHEPDDMNRSKKCQRTGTAV